MDGWMDRSIDRWMDGSMNEQHDGCIVIDIFITCT